jgi:hypothetical protein
LNQEEEEVYKEIKREYTRDYYTGWITREEYERKIGELEERRYGGGTGGGGFSFFPKDSIWTDLDLPPEKFDLYMPITVIGMGFLFLVGACVFPFLHQDFAPKGGFGWWFIVISFALMGIMCIVPGILVLRDWRKKKCVGEYELRKERYWQTHS